MEIKFNSKSTNALKYKVNKSSKHLISFYFGFFSLLLFTVSTVCQAQTILFKNIQPAQLTSPLPFLISVNTVTLNFEGLKQFPDQLRINFPGGLFTIVPKTRFEPRSGYIYRDEVVDPPGTPPFRVDPNAALSDFSYLWAGSNDEYDVVITVIKGRLVATIAGNSKFYAIQLNGIGNYDLYYIYLPGMPSNANDVVSSTSAQHNSSVSQVIDKEIKISHLKTINLSDKISVKSQNRVANPSYNELDVLVVYTEDARIDAGADANNPNDTAAMELNIQQVVDKTNLALSQSGTATRITKFHMAKITGFANQDNVRDTLRVLQANQTLQALRTNVDADMVSLIIKNNPFTGSGACGAAFSQTTPSDDWSVGTSFGPWAYTTLQQRCVILDNTFSHEMGHLMGTHHVRGEDELTIPGQDQAVIDNGYPYAFGYASNSIKTLMSVTPATTSRRLYFSNPLVIVNGEAIGDSATADNARVIDELAPAMELYRQRPDLIFVNGFE